MNFGFAGSVMSQTASAPRLEPIVELQVGELPPPSSPVNRTFLPSLLIVALCQNAKFSSSTEASELN